MRQQQQQIKNVAGWDDSTICVISGATAKQCGHIFISCMRNDSGVYNVKFWYFFSLITQRFNPPTFSLVLLLYE